MSRRAERDFSVIIISYWCYLQMSLSSETNHVKHFKTFFPEGLVLFLKNKAKIYINMNYLVYFLSTFIIFLTFSRRLNSYSLSVSVFVHLLVLGILRSVHTVDACTRVERLHYIVHCKKRFSCPQPGFHFPNSPLLRMFKLFPAREILVRDIPAGDGKIDNHFYSV